MTKKILTPLEFLEEQLGPRERATLRVHIKSLRNLGFTKTAEVMEERLKLSFWPCCYCREPVDPDGNCGFDPSNGWFHQECELECYDAELEDFENRLD